MNSILVLSIILMLTKQLLSSTEICEDEICGKVDPEYIEVGITTGVNFSCSRNVYYEYPYPFRWTIPSGRQCLDYCYQSSHEDCKFLDDIKCNCYNSKGSVVDCDREHVSMTWTSGLTGREYVGTWICHDRMTGRDIDITVREQEHVNATFITPPTGTTVAGLPYNFSCTATNGLPAAQIYWFLKEYNITEHSQSVHKRDNNNRTFTAVSTLSYTASKEHNQHNLRCEAWQSGHKQMQDQLQLDIQYAPSVCLLIYNQSHTSKTDVLLGSPLQFTCQWLEGNPGQDIIYRFEFNGSVVQKSGNNTFLMLTSKTDSGQYVCTAENNIGNSSESYSSIRIIYSPEIILQINFNSYLPVYEALPDKYLHLMCVLNDANPKDNIYYTFYIDGVLYTNSTSNSFTVIHKGEKSEMLYQCKGRNKAGLGLASQTIVVTNLSTSLGPGAVAGITLLTLTFVVLFLTSVVVIGFVITKSRKDFKQRNEDCNTSQEMRADIPQIYENLQQHHREDNTTTQHVNTGFIDIEDTKYQSLS